VARTGTFELGIKDAAAPYAQCHFIVHHFEFSHRWLRILKVGTMDREVRFMCYSKSNSWLRLAQHQWLMPCLANQDGHCAPLMNLMGCPARVISVQTRRLFLICLMSTAWVQLNFFISSAPKIHRASFSVDELNVVVVETTSSVAKELRTLIDFVIYS